MCKVRARWALSVCVGAVRRGDGRLGAVAGCGSAPRLETGRRSRRRRIFASLRCKSAPAAAAGNKVDHGSDFQLRRRRHCRHVAFGGQWCERRRHHRPAWSRVRRDHADAGRDPVYVDSLDDAGSTARAQRSSTATPPTVFSCSMVTPTLFLRDLTVRNGFNQVAGYRDCRRRVHSVQRRCHARSRHRDPLHGDRRGRVRRRHSLARTDNVYKYTFGQRGARYRC